MTSHDSPIWESFLSKIAFFIKSKAFIKSINRQETDVSLLSSRRIKFHYFQIVSGGKTWVETKLGISMDVCAKVDVYKQASFSNTLDRVDFEATGLQLLAWDRIPHLFTIVIILLIIRQLIYIEGLKELLMNALNGVDIICMPYLIGLRGEPSSPVEDFDLRFIIISVTS